MSAKQEQAQAPATVSHADTGPIPQHPLQHQPHPPNFHQGQIIYQQPYTAVSHFQHQGATVWNPPQQAAAVHYVQYAPAPPQPEPMNFQENKVQGYNHFGTVHFAQPMDNGDMMMRNHQPTFVGPQYAQPTQWYATAQPQQQPQAQFIPTYATTFNVANDPTYHPNHPMNRPGAGRREDFQSGGDTSSGYMQFVPFVAPIGVMESQAHASASYTANWVSSTSSIPPEMKDEPESDNISQYDSQRPTSQLNGDNWTDHEDHLSPSTTQQSFNLPPPRQMPYVEKDKSPSQSTTKTSKSAKGERTDGKRELTFDERLQKARMQKSRVENEGGNRITSPNSSQPAQGSNTITSPTMDQRSYGQPSNYSGYARQEGFNNNSNNHNRGVNNYYYNGNQGQNGGYFAGEPQIQQTRRPYQQPQYNRGNAVNAHSERDRQPKRDNNYSNNRFENNQQNASYKYQPQNNQQQNQNRSPRDEPSENYRQPQSYRGRGRGGYRGGYNNQGQQPPQQQQQQPPQQQNSQGNASQYAGAPMNPQMMATMNTFQNTHIGNPPPGPPRGPLLPGPFGMPRAAQDIKFHNTWLDASSCPMPLAAVLSMDTRFGRGGYMIPYRGRGRGNFGFRGGYRGGYGNGRFVDRAPEQPMVSTTETDSVSDGKDDEQKEDNVENNEESKKTDSENTTEPGSVAEESSEEKKEITKPEST